MAEGLEDGMSTSRLASVVAPAILVALDRYETRFRTVTQRARDRFSGRDWIGAVSDASERLDLYGAVVSDVENEVRSLLGERVGDHLVWAGIKAVYSALIATRDDWEVAETFFNSVTRRIFATEGVDQNIEYVDSDFDMPSAPDGGDLVLRFQGPDLSQVLARMLGRGWFQAPYEDVERDVALVAERVGVPLADLGGNGLDGELLGRPFFRRKGAYLVGRLVTDAGSLPLVISLLNGDRGVYVDAVLTDVDDVSILFSFTRSHFHVDLGPPYRLVRYLKQMMPRKPVAELYIALGYHKHGKTELYRDLLRKLRESEDQMVVAPGTRGMVMVVFTMPGYDVVFKVIRDHFPAIKPVTPSSVRDNYRLVFRHDRAGRLVEAQDFEHLKFELRRFEAPLIDEFKREADRTVELDGEEVVIHQAYLERRVTPLDLYLREADEEAATAAVIDFGQAVKDLAAHGIFPGELLPKNFGVTRHGRVVCYDYDELGLLTDFTFRPMPQPKSDEDEFGEEAWFGVGPRDVFPEEFRRFIGLPPNLLGVLDRHHSELYGVEFWQETQDRVRRGDIIDIFPYPRRARLRPDSRDVV